MKPSVITRLAKLTEEGEAIDNDYVGDRWAKKVAAFLWAADAPDEHDSFTISLRRTFGTPTLFVWAICKDSLLNQKQKLM